MWYRCYNPKNHAYHRYGGRGIVMDDAWHDFERFVTDVLPSCPGEGYSIDRIDNNKGYGPDNFRWATSQQQSNNRRSNARYDFRGRTLTLAEIAREVGIPSYTISRRIRLHGESAEVAIESILKRKESK